MPQFATSICWLRRDLRLDDHAALYHALKAGRAVHCVFVFDTDILDGLVNRADRRVEFIWHSVRELRSALRQAGSDLHVLHGSARQLIPRLARQLGAQAVYCNHDVNRIAGRATRWWRPGWPDKASSFTTTKTTSFLNAMRY